MIGERVEAGSPVDVSELAKATLRRVDNLKQAGERQVQELTSGRGIRVILLAVDLGG